MKTQQNNFLDLKANLKASNDKHVIFEDPEETEDDVAQIIPSRVGHNDLAAMPLSQTQKLGIQSLKQGMNMQYGGV